MPTINYDIILNEPGQLLLIEDRCNDKGGMSITNGAEAVVGNLFAHGLLTNPDGTDRDLLYVDTDGQVDRLLHDKGTFLDFSTPLIAQMIYIKEHK